MRFPKTYITVISNYLNENGEQGKYRLLLKPKSLQDKKDILNCINEVIKLDHFEIMKRKDNYSKPMVADLFSKLDPNDVFIDSDFNKSDDRSNKSIVYILTINNNALEKYNIKTAYGIYIKILFIGKNADYSTTYGILPNLNAKPKVMNVDSLSVKITFISAHEAKNSLK